VHGASTIQFRRMSSVFHVARKCSRTACAEKPTITLSFQYNRAVVWIDDLLAEEDPHCYDLCAKHGERVTAPSGWHLEDRRRRANEGFSTRLAG
jgi:hypothetical protein